MKIHIAQPRDCVSSIAFENGHFWQTIWLDDQNAALREKRQDGFVLMQGDQVFVPDLRFQEIDSATGQRHRFRRKGVPDKLRLRFGDDDYPRANIPYTLTIDGHEVTGTTDAKGELSQYLMPNAQKAELILRPSGAPEEHYSLQLRALAPVTEILGQQMRLKNLHYYDGPIDGHSNEELAAALRDFQAFSHLQVTGEADEDTRNALLAAHGC